MKTTTGTPHVRDVVAHRIASAFDALTQRHDESDASEVELADRAFVREHYAKGERFSEGALAARAALVHRVLDDMVPGWDEWRAR